MAATYGAVSQQYGASGGTYGDLAGAPLVADVPGCVSSIAVSGSSSSLASTSSAATSATHC